MRGGVLLRCEPGMMSPPQQVGPGGLVQPVQAVLVVFSPFKQDSTSSTLRIHCCDMVSLDVKSSYIFFEPCKIIIFNWYEQMANLSPNAATGKAFVGLHFNIFLNV